MMPSYKPCAASTSLSREPRQLKGYILALVVLIFLAVEAGWATAIVMANKGTDFYLYYLAAEALKRGWDIYSLYPGEWQRLAIEVKVPHYVTPYLYPPLLATLIQPLTLLPPRYAFAVWSGINVLIVLITAFLLSRWLTCRWVAPWIFIGLAGYVPVLTTVYAGQVNLFVLLAVVAYLYALDRDCLGGAGLALAAGVMFKPIPIALAFHAVWKRRFRIILWLLVGVIVLVLITLPAIGWRPYQSYVRHSLSLAGLTRMGEPGVYPPNQALSGFFGRLLTYHEFGGSLTDSPALAKALTLIFSFVLVLATGALCWPERISKDLFALEAGLVIVTTHLITPTGWFHHLALAFVAFAVAWRSASSRERLFLLIAYTLVNVQGLFWHQLVGHTALLSLGTYGLLILWGVLAWRITRTKMTN